MLSLAHATHRPHLRPPSRAPAPRCSPARARVRLHNRSHSRTLTRARPPSAEASEAEATSTAATTGSGGSSSVLSFLCPLLKFLGGGDPSQERNDIVEVTTSSLSSLARLPWGSSVATSSGDNFDTATSAPTLQLYEFEACPFCRRVREAITELDLSAEVYPCPKGSLRHRDVVKKIGGKEQFPLLVDASSGVTMYESGDIVEYLFRQYGQGKSPSFGLLESHLHILVLMGNRAKMLVYNILTLEWLSGTVKYPGAHCSSESPTAREQQCAQYNFHRMGAYSSSSWKRNDIMEQSWCGTCREVGTLLV